MQITSISEILAHFDIDEEGALKENSYTALKRAIVKERITIDGNLLCFSLCQPVKFFRSGAGAEDRVARFRSAQGGDHRVILNSGGKNSGNCLFKIIGRLCDITDKCLENHPIGDVKVMEDIVNLFL